MTTILLRNATILELDPADVRRGSLLIRDGRIDCIAPDPEGLPDMPDAEVLDCSGFLLAPALVNGHTHLYSALALGMPPPARSPGNFLEILQLVWWKLDAALDEESIYMSALVGATRAALCGCGTLVDHHASPNCIPGSLDIVRQALSDVGLRGVLCYEVTDRHGIAGARAGVEENARFLRTVAGNGWFAGSVGAHASFTLGDESLDLIADVADQYEAGIHIHCAEDPIDVDDARRRSGAGLIERLAAHRILRPRTVLGHCTHLETEAIQQALDSGCWIAHNPRSNMNNAVGYAPVAGIDSPRIMLGTDGIDGDLFAESRDAFLKARDARARVDGNRVLGWISASMRFASHELGVELGKVKAGAAADLMLLRYDGLTPITPGNLPGHWLFGLGSRHVNSVMVGGRWVVREGILEAAKAKSELERAHNVATELWKRFEASIPQADNKVTR